VQLRDGFVRIEVDGRPAHSYGMVRLGVRLSCGDAAGGVVARI
jgi:hypothetical protein